MTSPTYFFINHDRKEFCYFQNDVPAFGAIGAIMNYKTGWLYGHNIVVSTDKLLSAKILMNSFLNEKYVDISTTLPNLKQKSSFMDKLFCRSIKVVYPLWDSISELYSNNLEILVKDSMANLDTMKKMETLVATSV